MRLLVAALVCAASAGAAIDLRFQPFCDEAYYGGARTVEKAIRYLGVDVDYPCPTANGTMTALIIASIYGHKEVLRVLLSHGADVNAVDNNGMQPVDLAMASVTNREAVLDVLRAADATLRAAHATLRGAADACDACADDGCDACADK